MTEQEQSSSGGNASNDTITTNENDVVSGRGSGANRHKGNLVFRQLIKKNKAYYLSLGKNLKMGVARAIFDEIASKDPPGRFLQKNPETDRWFEVKRERALEKISQALREKPSAKKADHPTGVAVGGGVSIPGHHAHGGGALESQQNVNYAPHDSTMAPHTQRNSYHQHPQHQGFHHGESSSSRSSMMEQSQARADQGFSTNNFRNPMYDGMRGRGSHLGVSPMAMDVYEMSQHQNRPSAAARMQRMQVMDMNMNAMNMNSMNAMNTMNAMNIPQQGFSVGIGVGPTMYHPTSYGAANSLSYQAPSSSYATATTRMMAMPSSSQQSWVDMAPMPAIPDVPQEFLRSGQSTRMAPIGPPATGHGGGSSDTSTMLGRPPSLHSHSPPNDHGTNDPYILVSDRPSRGGSSYQHHHPSMMSSSSIPATPLLNYRGGRPELQMDNHKDTLSAMGDTTGTKRTETSSSPTHNNSFVVVPPRKRGHFSSSGAGEREQQEQQLDSSTSKRRRTVSATDSSPKDDHHNGNGSGSRSSPVSGADGTGAGITVDTDLDRLGAVASEDGASPDTIATAASISPPKLVSPQHEDDRSLSHISLEQDIREKTNADRDRSDRGHEGQETDQTGLATLSTAASLMSKQ